MTFTRDFRNGPIVSSLPWLPTARDACNHPLAIPPTARSWGVRAADRSGPEGLPSATAGLSDTPSRVARLSASPTLSAPSGRMPRQSLDAPEDLPKEAARQVALGQLEDEVPRMPDQPPARLEQPLLETREGPTLDSDGQDEPTEQMPRL